MSYKSTCICGNCDARMAASKSTIKQHHRPERCHGENCKCCEVFGVAYGETLEEAGALAEAAVAKAFALYAAGGPDPTPRLVPLQEFNIAASKLVSDAFTTVCISCKCCVGYAAAVKKGLIAIFSFTVSGIFIPTIPIGTGPQPPFVPGQSVYKNIAIALELMAGVVATAKEISSRH